MALGAEGGLTQPAFGEGEGNIAALAANGEGLFLRGGGRFGDGKDRAAVGAFPADGTAGSRDMIHFFAFRADHIGIFDHFHSPLVSFNSFYHRVRGLVKIHPDAFADISATKSAGDIEYSGGL